MIVTLTAFSQKDTTSTTKCFPNNVVKLIIKDILSGDSAKAQLSLTEQQLKETEKKVDLKDSIIYKMELKDKNYLDIILDERSKYGILEDHTKKLETGLKIEKLKGRFSRSILGGAAAILTILLIVK